MERPTITQINYAMDLIMELGYDLDDFDFKQMSKLEVDILIKELIKEELEYVHNM